MSEEASQAGAGELNRLDDVIIRTPATSRDDVLAKLLLGVQLNTEGQHLSEESAFETLAQAKPWLSDLAGVGLDSSEVGHPPAKFARVMQASRDLGLKVVAHAGEEGPPAYVWEAIDLVKVDRIDHGNRALEDEALTARLVKDGTTLTVCPLSNLKLCGVPSLDVHPLKTMLNLGLKAIIRRRCRNPGCPH